MTLQGANAGLPPLASIIDAIATIQTAQEDFRPLLDTIEEMADQRSDIAVAVARAAKFQLEVMENAFTAVTDYCRQYDMDRIAREMRAADMADTLDGQGVRDLSREIATKVEAMCAPAMRAITNMQAQAGQLDAMVQRARDMAGCLRPIHSAGRDPNRPPHGSLRATVEDSMGVAPGTLTGMMWARDGVADRPLDRAPSGGLDRAKGGP